MTNAGFYLSTDPSKAKDDLKNWCEKYYHGLKTGSLFLYPAADPFFFNVRKRIEFDNKSIVKYNFFPQPEDFFKMLKGKRVLIVSPFKTLLEKMVSESRLKNLYKNFLIDDTDFYFIQAPISIYPNRPGYSWTESYLELYDNTSKIIESAHIDI